MDKKKAYGERQAPEPALNDRMRKYSKRFTRNPPCPECETFPTVCVQRRDGFASFRCRECGHRFTMGNLLEKLK